MSEPRTTVHLVSQEGDQFEVLVEVALMSELVKALFAGLFVSSSSSFLLLSGTVQLIDEIHEIQLPNVKTHTLAKVIEYAEHYQVDPMNHIAKVRTRIWMFLSPSLLNDFISLSHLPT